MGKTLEERFWLKVDRRGPDECWLWTGAKTIVRPGWPKTTRYGVISNGPKKGGRQLRAHRVSWELNCGPIPDGYTIDHTCEVTLCVNPAHLEPVTFAENTKRQWDRRGRAEKCPQGHTAYRERWHTRKDGTKVKARYCHECHKERQRRRYVPVSRLPQEHDQA
jgi:hypothetical protein